FGIALIGLSPRGRQGWKASLRQCAQAALTDVPIPCHQGMSLHSSPIMHDRRRLAVLVVGTRSAQAPAEKTLRAMATEYELDYEELRATVHPEFTQRGGTPEAIREFADFLADTVATLYAQAHRIGQQLTDLRVVHGLADLLAGTLDLQQILDLTVQRVVEAMPVKACAIRLLDEDSGELVIQAVHNLSREYLNKGPVMLAENRIDADAFGGQIVYIEDMPNDPRTRYPDNARREGIVSGLCAPMTYRGQTIGVLRVYTGKRYRFSESQQQLLRSIGSQAASAIINARFHEQQAATDHFQRQVKAAAQIQRRMLPSQPAPCANLEFGCVYDPSLTVGGDFYDFFDLPDGSLGICIADVVGKGLPAALLMASVRASLRAHAEQQTPNPSAAAEAVDLRCIMGKVNRHLCRDTLISEFATVFFGALARDGRSLTFCNAGQTPPLLLRDDQFTSLTTGGMVIGVQTDESYEQQTLALQTGDILALVTDGVIEAIDFSDKAYGWDSLLNSIRKHQSLPAQQLAQQLLWDVRRFVGLADQSDDITILVVKIA
ncbi:MAG: SpoIIE family protein phosphatase, partial [Planctomycetes bacterium]|nr:SpoIIE family protein phosphatase [Planctomycetota bacterium]